MGHTLGLHRGVRSSVEDCSWRSILVVGWAGFWIVSVVGLRRFEVRKSLWTV
jgi:hypothetical protein